MEKQKLFNEAYRNYFDCQAVISEIYKRQGEKISKKNREYYLEIFDLILQSALLFVSIRNGRISELEMSFLDKLTTEEDLICYLNRYLEKSGKNKLTWDAVCEYLNKLEDPLEIFTETFQIIKPRVDDFNLFVGAVDSYTTTNYLEFFKEKITTICSLLAQLDAQLDNLTKEKIKLMLDRIVFNTQSDLKKMFENIEIKINI